MPLSRADHDDVATIAGREQLDGGVTAVVDSVHVDVEASMPVLVVELANGGERLHRAGVVDKDVQSAEDFFGSIKEPADLGPIGHVCRNYLGMASRSLDTGRDLVELVEGSRREHD